MLGRLTDGGGKAIAKWVQDTYPEFKPKRILDIGCGLGHNTLPIALAYPEAEIIAIGRRTHRCSDTVLPVQALLV